MAKDALEDTKRRISALPILRERIEENAAQLEEIRANGAKTRSNDIKRFSASGSRIDPEEALELIILDMESSIAADAVEVKKIERILEKARCDPYYRVLEARYIEKKTDDAIASEIPCDVSTVRRNRNRLIEELSLWLYGAYAI
jgi:hypothetical protein